MKSAGSFGVWLIAGMCLVLSSSAWAGVSHDSRLDWFSISSDHFIVHYHNDLKEHAQEVLAISERVHRRLSKRYSWNPRRRTEIVLTNESDLANGSAVFFPSNRMTLQVPPPDDIRSLEDHAGWMELLIEHEYVHILHLDKVRSWPEGFRTVFGRNILFFPNAFNPFWVIEGMATYEETDFARGIGRGQSSFFNMLIRMEMEGKLKPIHQVNQPIVSWPAGTTRYLYGVHFIQFVADRYGDDKVIELVEEYSNNLLPFFINTNSRKVLGEKLTPLWEEYEAYLHEEFDSVTKKIKSRGIRDGERLTKRGYFTGPLSVLPDGRAFYINYDGRRYPALWRISPEGTHKKLATLNFNGRLDAHATSGVLISQTELCNNASTNYDLYVIDSETGKKRRLTRCARFRFSSWMPDGQHIIAVQNQEGNSALQYLDDEGRLLKNLWQGSDGTMISNPDVSPDGRYVVASLWRPKTGWNLELFDIDERRWQPLTRDSAIENHPRFDHNGENILFTADYDGVYNIRRLEIKSSRIETLTNVLGGAFYPGITGDGRSLIYIGANPEGFDVYRIPLQSQKTRPPPQLVLTSPGPTGIPLPPAQPVDHSDQKTYSPGKGLLPTWWFPRLSIDSDRTEIGALTSGWDALQRHVYAADIAYDTKNEVWVGQFDYFYDRWLPIVKFSVGRSLSLLRNTTGEIVAGRFNDEIEAGLVFPWLSVKNRWTMQLGVVQNTNKEAYTDPGYIASGPFEDNVLGLAGTYASTRIFPKSISRIGRELLLVAEDSDTLGDSFYTGQVYTGGWREFVPLVGEHVLALRLTAGYGTEQPRPFSLGGTGNVNFLPPILAGSLVDSPFNRRQYALRGYPEGLPQLTGRRMNLASLEYRFPLGLLERGYMAPPIGVHQFHGSLFVDTGAAWNDSRPDEYFTGAGLELTADMIWFYSLPIRLTVGGAHGFDAGGIDDFYVRLSAAF